MFHTSPSPINPGTINEHGPIGSCLCFSSDVYSTAVGGTLYVYEADFDCVSVSRLYDDEIVARIAERFGCDLELAEYLLDGSESEWNQSFSCDADDSFWLQQQRGECAVKMGYDGCRDTDEQGTVYIVPMLGREHELTFVRQFER